MRVILESEAAAPNEAGYSADARPMRYCGVGGERPFAPAAGAGAESAAAPPLAVARPAREEPEADEVWVPREPFGTLDPERYEDSVLEGLSMAMRLLKHVERFGGTLGGWLEVGPRAPRGEDGSVVSCFGGFFRT